MGEAPTAVRRQRGRNIGPLLMALVLLPLLAVLPSSLNLPQATPSQTLEYAPVPPEDGDPPVQLGNLSSLGLAESGTVGTGPATPGEGPGDGAGLGGVGKNPRTKKCVGVPPRQTGDPLAPPCVAHFSGDNFGSTYQGVTAEEIRVLVYHECCIINNQTSKGVETDPDQVYFDLAEPLPESNSPHARSLQALQRYFNDRFQTYDRFVHVWLYFATNSVDGAVTPEARRADAIDNYKTIKPFAVMTYTTDGNEGAYLDVMASKGVMNFGSVTSQRESSFQRKAGLKWNYPPSLEKQAKAYADTVCSRIVNRPVSFSGNAADGGLPRVLGLLYVDNPAFPGFRDFALLVKSLVEGCGGSFREVRTFRQAGYVTAAFGQQGEAASTAAENMAAFKTAGVTTIIWPQGFETNHGKAGAQIDYRPEWITAGDGANEGNTSSRFQDQDAWSHTWVVTPAVLVPPVLESRCAEAHREGDPEMASSDIRLPCNLRNYYTEFRQLFTGIQVAGPRLTPASVEKGFRAIPAIPSGDPTVPACYYEPGDYTCVKDSVAMWWDPAAIAPGGNQPGCWRMPEGGRRFLPGQQPQEDLASRRNPAADPCNSINGVFYAQ
ncbi:MAG TPA: hypothetical protein VMY88_00255 [Acidimicrobiales bacterium]|nr:hypothetical protein [Acidimicrobiales bacterium]